MICSVCIFRYQISSMRHAGSNFPKIWLFILSDAKSILSACWLSYELKSRTATTHEQDCHKIGSQDEECISNCLMVCICIIMLFCSTRQRAFGKKAQEQNISVLLGRKQIWRILILFFESNSLVWMSTSHRTKTHNVQWKKKKDMKKGNQTRKDILQVDWYQQLVGRNKVCLKNIAFDIWICPAKSDIEKYNALVRCFPLTIQQVVVADANVSFYSAQR